MIPDSATRVQQNTAACVNDQIQEQTTQRLREHVASGSRTLSHRLDELDREWDIERALEANAATATLVGLSLGKMVDRRFYWLPVAVAGFLLQHAVQGWCPLLPILRRLGFRTQTEIAEERYALKVLRGDFKSLGTSKTRSANGIEEIIEAVQR